MNIDRQGYDSELLLVLCLWHLCHIKEDVNLLHKTQPEILTAHPVYVCL